MACNDELVDLKLRRRLQIGDLEVRNSRKYFVQVAFAPVPCRQVLNAVVSSKTIACGIFETQEHFDKHPFLLESRTCPRIRAGSLRNRNLWSLTANPCSQITTSSMLPRRGVRRKIDGRRL